MNEDSELCGSRLQNLLRGDKSTIRLGLPACFLVTTILWHHLTGSPYGTT